MASTEPQAKDVWDKTQAIAGILSGIAIPIVVVLLGQKTDDLKTAIVDSSRDREIAASEAMARAAQANIIPPLIDGLLSDNLQRRKLAMAAIVIALPEDGPRLVRELSQSVENEEVKEYANAVLSNRKAKLVSELSAPEADTRKQAAKALVSGWRDDNELPKIIIDQAQGPERTENGVYNSVAVLQGLSRDSLVANKPNVEAFLAKAEQQGPRTAEQAARLRARLDKAE